MFLDVDTNMIAMANISKEETKMFIVNKNGLSKNTADSIFICIIDFA